MKELFDAVARYGSFLVFGNTFLEQLGVPVPAFPLFVVAGALAARDLLSFPAILAAAAAGALAADVTWYLVGRRYGWHVLRLLCSLTLSPESCVRRTSAAYERFGLAALLFCKFVPGLSAVTVPVTGALRAPFPRFLAWDAAGILIWAGAGIGLGAAFHRQVDRLLVLLAGLGTGALALLGAALAAWLLVKGIRRARTLRALRMARIEAGDLGARLDADPLGVLVLDVRSRAARREEPRKIPGALVVDLGELDAKLHDLPAGKDVALYCT